MPRRGRAIGERQPEPRVRKLDRYIFRQVLGPFLFFVLVFTGVIWLTQSLRVIDTVVNNGQSARVFLEFTALLLPMVLSIVLPVALFAAVLFAINRMFGDSEVVVMLAAGLSATSLLRAITVFGALVMIVMYAITLYIMPTAQREMRDRIFQIRGDVAAALLREGEFLEPVQGVTIYLREAGRAGEMFGVYVQDERDPEQTVTYTAKRAVLVRDGPETRMVMFEGVAQNAEKGVVDTISILRFDQLAYDLTRLGAGSRARARKPSEMYVTKLLTITSEEGKPRPLGDYRAEAHEALSAPLYLLALPMLAVAFVVSSGFRRQGFTKRIVMAALAGLALRLLGLAAKSAVSGATALWPLLYLPPILGVAIAILMLSGLRFRALRRTEAA